MESTSHKLAVLMCNIGQIIMAIASLIGLLTAVYVISVSNVPAYRLVEGSIIAFVGFAGCYILEKLKATLIPIQIEMGLTE